MRRWPDLPLLVVLMAVAGAAMLLPAAYAYARGGDLVGRAFLQSGGLVLVGTAILGLAVAGYAPRNRARSHLLSLLGAFLLLPVLLALPVVAAMPGVRLLDGWFEMLSCLTTTGATIFDEPGRVPPPVHLWRGLAGWLGGYFMLLAGAAILAPLNLGGFEVMSGAPVGRGAGAVQSTRVADPSERLMRYAGQILPVYAGLTMALWVGLLVAGDPGLVALMHAMGTLSTSGITPLADFGASRSGVPGEMLVFAFLVFAVTRRAYPGATPLGDRRRLWADPELRIFLVVAGLMAAGLFVRHWVGAIEEADQGDLPDAARVLWGSMFTVASFLTTTGYTATDWDGARIWSGLQSPGLILVGLALAGGGVATTAGGVKLLRVYALWKHGMREMEKLVHPSSVGGAGTAARALRRQGAYAAWIFFMLFTLTVMGVMAALAIAGLDFERAFIFAVAALSTTGPLAQDAGEVALSYATLDDVAKLVLGLAMVLGRLETLAIIALLAPDSWRG